MKYLAKIAFAWILLGSQILIAQQQSFVDYWLERDNLLSNYLSGNISPEYAFQRTKVIHAYFRRNGFITHAQEENLYVGYLYKYEGDYEKSVSSLMAGLKDIQPKNDTLTFKYICLLAEIHRQQREFAKAEEGFQKAFELQNNSIETTMPNEVIAFSNNYATLLNKLGETELEKIILDKAYSLAKSQRNTDYLGIIEEKLARYYIQKKSLLEGENYLKSSIVHTVKPFYRLSRLLNLADLYATQKRWNDFNKTLQLAKRDYAQIKNVSAENVQYGVRIKLLESEYLLLQNRKPPAISKVNEAVKLALTYGTKSQFLAKAYLALGDLSENEAAINNYNLAIAAVTKSGKYDSENFGDVQFPREFMEAMRKRAVVEKPTQAMKTYQAAIAFSVQIRKAFISEDSKYFYEEELRPLFGNALAVAEKSSNETFNIIEQSKAAVLNEVLQGRRIKFGNVNADLLKEEKQLQQAITKLKTDVSTKAATGSVEKLRELQIKQEFLSKKIEKESPNYFKLKYQNTAYSEKEIQGKLDENTALLSYFKSDSVLYISVLTKAGIIGKKIILSADYQQCMDYLREVLYTNPGLGNYTGSKAAQCMYGYLIKPVEKELAGKKRLLVIRDAELNLLPFEVLEYQPQKYLLSRFIISYNYAASLVFSEAENKKRNLETLSFAPYAERSVLQNKSRDRSLGALPFSNKEVSDIGGNIYRDKAATKKQFMEDYRKNGIIHFATHAQIDDQDPSKSFIAFYPDSVDYKLYTNELYNLSLENTQLVVLSACEAGRGKIQGGEGMLSLARGFAYAGCPAVITTLWNAHDESSAYLAERLHHYLKKGMMKDEVLQQAKLDFMNADIGRELNHPYYWANFILIGDASVVYEPTNWWLWGSISLLVLLTVWFAVRFSKRSS
jgi:CHAT domain-containing protein